MTTPNLEIIDYRLQEAEKKIEKAEADRREIIRELGKVEGLTEASQMKELLYTEIEENKNQRAQIAVLVDGVKQLRDILSDSSDKDMAAAAEGITINVEGGKTGDVNVDQKTGNTSLNLDQK